MGCGRHFWLGCSSDSSKTWFLACYVLINRHSLIQGYSRLLRVLLLELITSEVSSNFMPQGMLWPQGILVEHMGPYPLAEHDILTWSKACANQPTRIRWLRAVQWSWKLKAVNPQMLDGSKGRLFHVKNVGNAWGKGTEIPSFWWYITYHLLLQTDAEISHPMGLSKGDSHRMTTSLGGRMTGKTHGFRGTLW